MSLDKKTTDLLLTCGVIAGPLFVISSFVHGLLRPGFDMVRNPASLLSLGDLGWIQIATFVAAGILYIASSFGLKSVLKSGIGSTFVAPLFIVVGVAFIAGGVFRADPSLGFPPGTPLGVPKEMSWHSMIHGFAPIIGFLATFIAMIILGRRFGKEGQKGWMWATIIIGIVSWILSSVSTFTGNWKTGEFNFIPLWLGVAVGYGYVSVLFKKIMTER